MHLMQQRLGKLLMQDEQQKKVIDLNEESDALSTRTNNILHNWKVQGNELAIQNGAVSVVNGKVGTLIKYLMLQTFTKKIKMRT